MSNDPTTARARRRQAVADGRATDAVDRLPRASNPGGSGSRTPTRSAQTRAKREVAEELEIGRDGVGSVDRIRGGIDMFLRSSGVDQFGRNVRADFADQASFVERDDVDPRIDAQEISAQPMVATNRRDDVADRARRETAADAEFIEPRDLDADVGARGVTGLEVADDRRDEVAGRARTGLAAEDPFAEPGDFDVQVGALGIEKAGLSADGQFRRAGRMFEAQTPLRSVDPFADITQTDSGFALDDDAQRRSAARGFENELDLFGRGELDPGTDIRDIDDGFGLGRGPARELAAKQIDEQIAEFDIGPGDIELRETGSGEFEGIFEREVER